MFEASGSWVSQQHSHPGSSVYRSCMIAPVNVRQHEVLPASVNPFRVSANLGFNEFGLSGWPEKGNANEGIDSVGNPICYSPATRCTPDRSPLEQVSLFPQVANKQQAYEVPCPQQRKFLVFDQSGNETRLMFSSLCPGVQNLPPTQTLSPAWNPHVVSNKQFDAYKFLPQKQARKDEQVFSVTPSICEESGENEILDEEREMREDTEEINALLYSDDDDDDDDDDNHDNDYDDEDDDEVSSGHSPLAWEGVCNKQEEQLESDYDDEVANSSIGLKRRKALDGGHEKLVVTDMTSRKQNLASENIHSEDFASALDEGTDTAVGSKRPRKDKIRDTLKVLERILPGLKSKDPVVILDEAISYLKCLKYNAVTMSAEDSNSSGCYELST